MDDPNRLISLICPTKYPDIFAGFQASVAKYLPNYPIYIVVNPEGPGVEVPPEWNRIEGLIPYCGGRNGNLVLRTVKDGDLFFCTDDITFTSENTISELSRLAYSDPKIGLIAPQVIGATGSHLQQYRAHPIDGDVEISENYIPFICFYLKREVIEKVGEFDENYTEYGPDDVDYCLRIKQAGYKLALTSNVVINHGNGTATFHRDRPDFSKSLTRMWAYFESKWGHRNTF